MVFKNNPFKKYIMRYSNFNHIYRRDMIKRIKDIIYDFYFKDKDSVYKKISDEKYTCYICFGMNFLDQDDIFVNNPELFSIFNEFIRKENIKDKVVIVELETDYYYFILYLIYKMYKKFKKNEFKQCLEYR